VEFFDPTEIENISMVSIVFQLAEVPEIKAQAHIKWTGDYDPEGAVIGRGADRPHLVYLINYLPITSLTNGLIAAWQHLVD
jgi:hypothetical protein